jgi:hypothetical protein
VLCGALSNRGFVFRGDPDGIVDQLRSHVGAGADHVAVQVVEIEPGRSAMPHRRLLADALPPRGQR